MTSLDDFGGAALAEPPSTEAPAKLAPRTLVHARVEDPTDLDAWRLKARELLRAEVPPEAVSWSVGTGDDLLAGAPAVVAPSPVVAAAPAARVPPEFLTLADHVLCLRDPQRHGLLYRLLWRLTRGEPRLLEVSTDDDVLRARNGAKSVKRDLHKMHAFVRFREVRMLEPLTVSSTAMTTLAAGDADAGIDNAESRGSTIASDFEDLANGVETAADTASIDTPIYIAWFEPEHLILERAAPFFVRRFAGMRWSILTPDGCAHWDGTLLAFTPGATRRDAPDGDALEDLWRTYYASIFNPARLKVQAMKSEMPVKYWKNLPEARLIPDLIRTAQTRTDAMVEAAPTVAKKRIAGYEKAAPAPVPAGSIAELREQAKACRNCDLWKPATQTVFGEGPETAKVVVIGEQPGDQEDLAGRPFIGPAGKLFDRALAAAGIDRSALYITNTVKHFKFEPRGKFRLHKRAAVTEQNACRPWLDAELTRLQPQAVVCLGSMASAAVFGSKFKLLQERGEWRDLGDGRRAYATVHPSYLLRLPDEAARVEGFDRFVEELKLMKEVLES